MKTEVAGRANGSGKDDIVNYPYDVSKGHERVLQLTRLLLNSFNKLSSTCYGADVPRVTLSHEKVSRGRDNVHDKYAEREKIPEDGKIK